MSVYELSVPAPYVYNATVRRVIDADTIEVDVDWGFHRHDVAVPVRILGINGRELTEPGGREARDNLASLVPPGTPVVLGTAKPDKYNPRWVAAVAAGSIADLAGHLVVTGWAVRWDGRGPKPVPEWPRTFPLLRVNTTGW